MSSKTLGDTIIFSSDPPVLSTVLTEKRMQFALKWKQWKPRMVTINQRGILVYKADNNVGGELDIKFPSLSYIPEEILLATLSTENLNKFIGLTIKCKTVEGYDTYFRCIMDIDQFESMKNAIRIASKEHNINTLGPIPKISEEKIEHHAETSKGQATQSTSVMRRTIAQAMSKYDVRSRHDQIVSRRGALRWLPTMFDNDLIHGSWWFTIGSIGFFLTAALTLANSYDSGELMGDDDSTLTLRDYRATWVLMVVSAIFCIFGSLAFVRALHEDPPMPPLFGEWYHFQNDELLGSWLFFFAAVPLIPYSLVYLSEGGYRSLLYLGSLGLSIFVCIACFMFVLACYPTDQTTRKNVFMPVMKVICRCCCSKRWLQMHLRNDWLAGVWFFLWASSFATFGNAVLLLEVLVRGQMLQTFILGTSLVENIAFLIGSAYFVAGSYPDGAMVIDDDFLDTSVEEGGFYLRGGKVSTHASDDELGGNSNNALEMLAGRGVGTRRGLDVVNPILAQHFEEEASRHGAARAAAAAVAVNTATASTTPTSSTV